jgi:multiple sugar transport system ATP-binding protein
VLHQGQLQQIDEPGQLYQQPINRFVAGFVGWPPMNFVDGELQRDDEGTMVFAGGVEKLPVPEAVAAQWEPWLGRPLTLGIRPENVVLGENRQGGWAMHVRLVEWLGRGRLVTLACGNCEITALLSGGCHSPEASDTMLAGKKVMVILQLQHGYLFDRSSGQTLKVRPAG